MESFDVTLPSKKLSEIPDKCFLHYFKNLVRCGDNYDLKNIVRFYDNYELKRDLESFHLLFKRCAYTRNEIFKKLFCSDKELTSFEKKNLSRMLYIENLRSRRYIHKFYRDKIDKNCKENNEFIEWIEEEIDKVEMFVIWPGEETETETETES